MHTERVLVSKAEVNESHTTDCFATLLQKCCDTPQISTSTMNAQAVKGDWNSSTRGIQKFLVKEDSGSKFEVRSSITGRITVLRTYVRSYRHLL